MPAMRIPSPWAIHGPRTIAATANAAPSARGNARQPDARAVRMTSTGSTMTGCGLIMNPSVQTAHASAGRPREARTTDASIATVTPASVWAQTALSYTTAGWRAITAAAASASERADEAERVAAPSIVWPALGAKSSAARD